MVEVKTISREQLEQRFSSAKPNNEDEQQGFALVNVLDAEAFEAQHIPKSINIPLDKIDEFERRFSKDKEIIVYCASPECEASPKAAGALIDKGFDNVRDYEGGVSDWKKGGHPLEGARG